MNFDEYLRRLAYLESGNDPMAANPRSSARGLYQFMPDTAKQYGITAKFGTPEYTEQEQAAILPFTQDNYAALQKSLGREPSMGELYLAHQQGAGGATKILTNPNALASDLVGADAIALNAGNPQMTATDFSNLWVDKFNAGLQEPDYSSMTDEELAAIAGVELPPQDAREPDYSNMSDEELARIAGVELPSLQTAQPAVPSPQETYAKEHPLARTLGRAGRNAAIGLGSLADLGLLVPKTAALGLGLGAENLGATAFGQALQKVGATPTVASNIESLIDSATGDKLKPIGGIDKGADVLAQLISSAIPFSRAGDVTKAAQSPTLKTAVYSVLDPETALNQLPSVQAQKTAILPLPKVTDEGKRIADLAKKYDIPVGLDDVTDSAFYKTMISEGKSVPFSGSQKQAQNQMSKFTKAVSRTIGAETDQITPEVISERFDTVGKQIGSFLEGKKINVGNQFGGKIEDYVIDNIENYTEEGQKRFTGWMDKIRKVSDSGGMVDGTKLEGIRKQANKVARESESPELAGIARNIEKFIIDAAEDSQGIDAKDISAFRKAKHQYKNLIAIEPLASKDQIGGQISPAQLLGRVRQVYGRSFSKGEAGELGDLANIGQYIKETIPNSGTAQRTTARNLLTGNLGVAPFLTLANPLAGAAQAGASGLGMLANRGLQSRNFDQELLELAMQNLPKSPLLTQKGALAALAGVNTQQGNLPLLPKPPLRITVRPSDAGVRP